MTQKYLITAPFQDVLSGVPLLQPICKCRLILAFSPLPLCHHFKDIKVITILKQEHNLAISEALPILLNVPCQHITLPQLCLYASSYRFTCKNTPTHIPFFTYSREICQCQHPPMGALLNSSWKRHMEGIIVMDTN